MSIDACLNGIVAPYTVEILMQGMLCYSETTAQEVAEVLVLGEGEGDGSEPLVTLADAPPHDEAARDADSSEPLVSVVTLVDAPPHEVAARDADSSEAHVPPTTPPHPSTSHRLQKAALERSLTVE